MADNVPLGPGLSLDEAMQRLIKGNERFLRGESRFPRYQKDILANLSKGQKPYATILGCSDSRVPPELIFDAAFGEPSSCGSLATRPQQRSWEAFNMQELTFTHRFSWFWGTKDAARSMQLWKRSSKVSSNALQFKFWWTALFLGCRTLIHNSHRKTVLPWPLKPTFAGQFNDCGKHRRGWSDSQMGE